MPWYDYLAYFVAGCALANGVPHFVHGVSGKAFPTPFASPPLVGQSSPLVNALWGAANFLAGYVLLVGVGEFRLGLTLEALMVLLGGTATAVLLVVYFGRLRRST